MAQNQKMTNGIFLKILEGLLRRCFVLYLCAGLVIASLFNSQLADTNRLNNLKQGEDYLKDFVRGEKDFKPLEFEEALRYYKKLLKYFPDEALIYANMGFCYYHLNNLTEAINSYKKAITLDNHMYMYYQDMASISYQLNDFENAVSFLNLTLNVMPRTEKITRHLMKKVMDSHKTGFMPVLAQIEMKLQEDQKKVYPLLANSFYYLKNFPEMRGAALTGIPLDPQNAVLYYLTGLADFMMKEYQEAITFFSKAIELDPRDRNAYYYRGSCFQAIGDISNYKRDMEKSLSLAGKETNPAPMAIGVDMTPHFNARWMTLKYQIF